MWIANWIFASKGLELVQGMSEQWSFRHDIHRVSQGRTSGQEALPTAPEFYAAMVIVRECLHHLRFTGVVLQE
ncbi:hypothetical protein os4_25630 [Comamonadaceae bacterium OS-4]|nr:hypothetical protein os4_25630 [Comamonadaceae bacterium OS-4]